MRHSYSEYAEHDDGFELVGDEREEAYGRPDRRLPTIALTVFAMALFAGGLWFAYIQGTHHATAVATKTEAGGVPLIRADTNPTKVKPDQPGGMAIPDQNVSVYNEKPGAPAVEKLLPSAEKPLPRPTAPPPPIPAPSEAATPALPPLEAAAPPAPAPAPVPFATAKPPAAAKASAPAPVKPTTTAKLESAKPESAVSEANAGGPIKLRLGSLRSADAAREEWARLKRDNSDLLGKLTAVAIRTDLGDRGIYYRIEAGPVADSAAAAKVCNELKRRNFGCILAH